MSGVCVFFLMIRRPPRSTLDRSSAASDVYKRQALLSLGYDAGLRVSEILEARVEALEVQDDGSGLLLSLIHISEPTRPY